MISAGDRAPAFRLPSTHGEIALDDLLKGGARVVLAFYAEDATPACESEVAMLRDAHEVLAGLHADVVAVSADSVESHEAFAERLGGLPFALASDPTLEAARSYGVADPDDARRSRRALFVIGRDGVVTLAIVPFQPANISQVEALFAAIGAG